MKITIEIGGRRYATEKTRGISLAIPLQFDGLQPSFFDAPPAAAKTLEAGGFTGDTQRGGSCNVRTLHLTPHCNGTHTESVAHVTHDGLPPASSRTSLHGATLISISAEPRAGELVITARQLENALAKFGDGQMRAALIVRTLPNDKTKLTRRYGDGTPWFEPAAMGLCAGIGVEHLLTDLPSLDPMHDAGKLAAHFAFWGLLPGERRGERATRPHCTVTEMIYVPDDVADGYYLLDLQLPALLTDAVPSRPVIYPLEAA
ncbi:MAG: cyclase family protein [Gammaproteobacteria bacterium]